MDINRLVSLIDETQKYFFIQTQKQVNIALTLRNYFIGLYIAEYELDGADRAVYGAGIIKELAKRLIQKGIKQIRERHLYLCKQFYSAYPDILRTLSAKSYITDFANGNILRTLSANSETTDLASITDIALSDSIDKQATISYLNKLINNLTFSHFIELLKCDSEIKREFYEYEALKNNWNVRELKRAMDSMLYERTGLSKDKDLVLRNEQNRVRLMPENMFRNPFVLEFLNLKQENSYSENQLEEAIITHLQTFLLELGKGFCFEYRQKRITFDNTHYYIDLVFYHRILKCNVLIDLKLGEFTHADSGQMNVYLNYYRENEMNEGDNPPIGIILCAGKNNSLVKYATTGLSQQIFVAKYLINLPDEAELKRIIEIEQNKE